jgi:hypothetical protein
VTPYAATWLDEDEEAEIQVGAFQAGGHAELAYAYGYSESIEPSDLESLPLRNEGDGVLAETAATDHTEWRYATRPWRAGAPDSDLEWTLNSLEAAVGIWDAGA